MKRIGINGFGRIGRYLTRLLLERTDLELVHVNDIADLPTLAHLLKYDSVHGILPYSYEIQGDVLYFSNGKKLHFTHFRDPIDIPWSASGVEVVVESSGLFLERINAEKHLRGSVERVLLSAPSKDEDIKTLVLGVNDELLTTEDRIFSNASCTTNSAAPLVDVMKGLVDIESAYITTIHSYTTDQRLHDSPHRDLRRARAANLSIVPTSTGAAKAITRIFPELEGRMGGCGMRVPVPDGSLTDLTLNVKNAPNAAEVNAVFKQAAATRMKGIIEFTEAPLVSVDVLGNPHSVVFDSQLTSVVGNMIKLVGWYDNEAGYSNRLVDMILKHCQ